MKIKLVLLFGSMLLLDVSLKAQSENSASKLSAFAGTWDVYMEDGKDIIGEFVAAPLGKTPALQVRLTMPAMNTEVNGTWAYDNEMQAVIILEVTNTGLVRTYKGAFRGADVLYFEGFSKQKPDEVTEKSTLTWLSPDKIKVWSNDLSAKIEANVIMIKRK
jgi:hypothetical protein